jgi:hypothetical protein
MALTREIEEWTRGKPSLVQLREMTRVNRAELVVPFGDGAHHWRNIHTEQMRINRLLVEEQRTLRKDVRDLLQEQRTLRQTLMRTCRRLAN